MNPLRQWMKAATPKQREQLARRAKTSVAYLRQLAYGHRTASMEMALRIEHATMLDHTLEYVRKETLNKKWRKA